MQVLLLSKAQKQYRKLNEPIKGRIATAIRKLEENPPIETDLTDDERRIIADGMEEYKAHPERAVPLEAL